MKTYFAVVVRADCMTLGYILEPYPNEREAGLAELAENGDWVVGEFATITEAHRALALAMARPAGGMQ